MAIRHYSIDSYPLWDSVGYLIKRCSLLMSAKAEKAFESQPISFTQWIVLMNLRERQGPMSATELSGVMGHDMGALTRLVDTLEGVGLVRRQRSLRDRRAIEIELTPAGKEQAEDSLRLTIELLNELLAPFSATELKALVGQLQTMLVRLQNYEPDFAALVSRACESAKAAKGHAPVARKKSSRS
jgi:DNA-binding MarR family transcriptional regulator